MSLLLKEVQQALPQAFLKNKSLVCLSKGSTASPAQQVQSTCTELSPKEYQIGYQTLINSHGVPVWHIAIVIHKQNTLC